MKHCYLFLCLQCAVLIGFAQENKQIRSRRIQESCVRTEQLQKGVNERSYTCTHYDSKGREIEVKYFADDSSCVKVEQHAYNRKGKEIRETVIDSLHHKHMSTTSAYDRWNRLTERATTEDYILTERLEYSYNTFDDKTEEITYDGSGNIKKRTRFEYDKKGMLTRRTTENAKGEIIYDRTYRYIY
jgi:uncharacterized protein YxeA